MKSNMVKQFDWQILLDTARSAVCGLLPAAVVAAKNTPKALDAESLRRSALLACGEGWDVLLAAERIALAAAAGNCQAGSNSQGPNQLFPGALAFRKETPDGQAALPSATGKGAASAYNNRGPHTRKPMPMPTEDVHAPSIDAAQIAKLKKDTLEDFDDLDECAEELGIEPPSETAKTCARKLTLRILDEYPDYYIICPEEYGVVSISFSKGKGHFSSFHCNSDGSVACYVGSHGNSSVNKYESINGLPDNYMRQALAPQPSDYTS